jgi:hypothetical protein
LAKDVILVLFAGELTQIVIHPKPETLHFGVERAGREGYRKTLRPTGELHAIPFRSHESGPDATRVVDIAALGKELERALHKPLNAAEFALQMIEGVEQVRFSVHMP